MGHSLLARAINTINYFISPTYFLYNGENSIYYKILSAYLLNYNTTKTVPDEND